MNFKDARDSKATFFFLRSRFTEKFLAPCRGFVEFGFNRIYLDNLLVTLVWLIYSYPVEKYIQNMPDKANKKIIYI